MEAEYEILKKAAIQNGQEHVFQFWSQLSDEEKQLLIRDIQEIDFEKVSEYFKACTQATGKVDDHLEPLDPEVCGSVSESDPATLAAYEEEGLRAVSQGQVCVLLLAGGQGTRLGVGYPKGMYDVGLPSGKTLYQLQAERITRVRQMAQDRFGGDARLPWYIMTSEHTQEATDAFFRRNNHFGLNPKDVIFFEQYTLPALTFEGKIVMAKTYRVAKAPDGNGGLYRALREKGILGDMVVRGVKLVHVYCVDNILVRMADPRFLGFCVRQGAECAAKVVEKAAPTEAVGVVGLVKGRYQVVEYSEISRETSEKLDSDGRLLYRSGNICNHMFSISFLDRVCSPAAEARLPHHVARKKVPCVDTTGAYCQPDTPNAIKMEKFVFDVFHFADRFAVWDVPREREFAPLKNADTAGKDCPRTCRASLTSYHRQLLVEAGAKLGCERLHNGAVENNGNGDVQEEVTVEISPLVSYDGEGLTDLIDGKVLTGTCILVERGHDGPEVHQK